MKTTRYGKQLVLLAGGFAIAFALTNVGQAFLKDIAPGAPAGSCCIVDGKEGASQWSEAAGAWACKIGSISMNPGGGKITEKAAAAWWKTHRRSEWDKPVKDGDKARAVGPSVIIIWPTASKAQPPATKGKGG